MKTSTALKKLLKQTQQKQSPEYQVVRHHYTIIDGLVKAGQTFTSISQCLKDDGHKISAKKIKAFYEQIKEERTGTLTNEISQSQTDTQQHTASQPHQIDEDVEVEHQTLSRKERMQRLQQQQQLDPDSVKPPPLVPILEGEVVDP